MVLELPGLSGREVKPFERFNRLDTVLGKNIPFDECSIDVHIFYRVKRHGSYLEAL